MTHTRTYTHRELIFKAIDKERDRQDAKFGYTAPSILPGLDEHKKLAVLMEEVGEVARAMLEAEFADFSCDQATADAQWAHMETELIEVAAVAVAWLEFRRARDAGWHPLHGRI